LVLIAYLAGESFERLPVPLAGAPEGGECKLLGNAVRDGEGAYCIFDPGGMRLTHNLIEFLTERA
jgi:hypothetical protein